MNSKEMADLIKKGWSVERLEANSWVTKFRHAVSGGTCLSENEAWDQALNLEGEAQVLPTTRQAGPDISRLQAMGYDVGFDVHAVRNCWMVSRLGETISKGHASREAAWDEAVVIVARDVPVSERDRRSLLREIGYSTLYHKDMWECLYLGSVIARQLADEASVWEAASSHLKRAMDRSAKSSESFLDYKGEAVKLGFAVSCNAEEGGEHYVWWHKTLECRGLALYPGPAEAWRAAFNWARCNAVLFKDV